MASLDIIKAKDNDDKIIIINLNDLKKYERLNDANVFKLLFGIHENSKFGNYPMKENDGFVQLFKDFDIKQSDWLLFITFIKNGFISNKKSKDEFNEQINRLNDICNIFGGIESFDVYYNNFYNQIKEEQIDEVTYNPQCPEEDYKNLYSWALIDNRNINNFRLFATEHIWKGWSAHKNYHVDSFEHIWYRKLNNNTTSH
tara:strand:+ start:173 stop:772 length:600 start_codon:yes stop_codon:yes gene_type:complete